MERTQAVALLDRLHAAQNQFYSGGNSAPLEELLTPDITWVVPGANSLAGTYRGTDEVFAYFRRRRDLARGSFRMHRKDVLVGECDRIAALTDGTATIAGRERHWSTVGLYEVDAHQRVATCWLLALDQGEFDSIWSF